MDSIAMYTLQPQMEILVVSVLMMKGEIDLHIKTQPVIVVSTLMTRIITSLLINLTQHYEKQIRKKREFKRTPF